MSTNLILAPNAQRTIGQLTGIFNSANGVTGWANALVNAVLPAMSPTPDWYEEVNATISSSQNDANNWLNDTGPDVVSGMCRAFLNYSGTFSQVITTQVTPILQAAIAQGGVPTAAQQQELQDIFTSLQQIVTRHATGTKTLLAAMAAYKKNLDTSVASLAGAISNALKAEAAVSKKVQKIQQKIDDIELTLAADNSAATADSFNVESSMQSLAVGLTFSLTFDPVGFGIALLGLGVSIVISAEAEAQVQADLKEIGELTDKLGAADIQLAMLQGIVSNLQSLTSNIEAALSVYDDFDDSWGSAENEIASLLGTIIQPEIDINLIAYFNQNNLSEALSRWSQIAAFATKVLLAKVIPKAGVTISGTSVAPTVPAIQKNLVANLSLGARLTAWCSAIVNTTVAQAPGAWHPGFMAKLAVAQGHATEFLGVVGPNTLSAIPDAIIQFAAAQQEAISIVQRLLTEAGPKDLQPNQIALIKNIFALRLQPMLQTLLGAPSSTNIGLPVAATRTLYGTRNDLISFRTTITNDRKALVEGQQGAAQEVGLLEQDEQTMATNISTLDTEIANWNQDIEESEIGIGASLFAAVVGLALAIPTGGGSLVATGFGVAGLGGSIAATAVYSEKVKAATAKVDADQQELTNDQKEVNTLTAIIRVFEQLEQLNASAQTAAEQIVTMFAGLAGQTESTIRRLEEADSATAKGVLENILIDQALSDWATWAKLAHGVRNSIIHKQVLSQPQ